MGRKSARESLMKLLYQMDINDDYSSESINSFLHNESIKEDEVQFIIEGIDKVKENLETIDKNIETHSLGWAKNRIAKVDLAILRLAVYEILFREDIPIEVSINEALELSKRYSSDDSYKFVNGLLGGVVRDNGKDE